MQANVRDNVDGDITTTRPHTDKHNIDVRYFFGCEFLPGGHVVIACGTHGLKLLDVEFKVINELGSFTARGVCVVSPSEILVTKGEGAKMQYVQVLPVFQPREIITMDRKCYGVDYHDGVIYVTCHDAPGNGEVRVLAGKDGRLLNRIGFDNEKYMFSQPDYVKVNESGEQLFVSDAVNNVVTCLDTLSYTVLYTVADDRELNVPKGIFVDGDDLYICSHKSNTILVSNNQRRRVERVLTQDDGVEYPLCVAKRRTDGRVIVGLMGRDSALVAYRLPR